MMNQNGQDQNSSDQNNSAYKTKHGAGSPYQKPDKDWVPKKLDSEVKPELTVEKKIPTINQ